MTYKEKIRVLQSYLNKESNNYRDSFKTELYLYFNENFSVENLSLKFLEDFQSRTDIEEWVDFVTSQIVLKFDEEFEQLGDFIGEFVELKRFRFE